MVKVTHTDGTTVEYELIDDPDRASDVTSIKHVSETITEEAEQVDQVVKINLAHLSIEDIEQRFDEDVASAIREELQ